MISLTERETLQHRPAGTILFNEGDVPRGIYLIHSGTVELLMRARNGDHACCSSAKGNPRTAAGDPTSIRRLSHSTARSYFWRSAVTLEKSRSNP